MLELSRENFKAVVDQQAIVLIECWAPGCGVCAQFDPAFTSVAEKNPGHTFARMNVLTDEKLGEFFEIEHHALPRRAVAAQEAGQLQQRCTARHC